MRLLLSYGLLSELLYVLSLLLHDSSIILFLKSYYGKTMIADIQSHGCYEHGALCYIQGTLFSVALCHQII